jgi:hypothetical protein
MYTHQYKIISIAALLSILLITCGLPSILSPKQSEQYSQGTGYSDAQGQTGFQDKVSGTKSNIKVVDADTRQPVSNIRVEYLSNGKRMRVVAYDESGQYIYSTYEGPINSTS